MTIVDRREHEPCDPRLAALWRHDSPWAMLPREVRIQLIDESSRQFVWFTQQQLNDMGISS